MSTSFVVQQCQREKRFKRTSVHTAVWCTTRKTKRTTCALRFRDQQEDAVTLPGSETLHASSRSTLECATFATCYTPDRDKWFEFGKQGLGHAFDIESRTPGSRNSTCHRREWGMGSAVLFLTRKAERYKVKAHRARKAALGRRPVRDAILKKARKTRDWSELNEYDRANPERRRLFALAKHFDKCAARAWKRRSDLVSDAHYRLANNLCHNYDLVLLPEFAPKSNVQKTVSTSGRRRLIGRTTVTKLMAQSHSSFKRRLLDKAEEYGTIVEIVDEAYTSKTCGHCGEINKHLGASEVFACPKCRWSCPRDLHGARNVLIRYAAMKLPY